MNKKGGEVTKLTHSILAMTAGESRFFEGVWRDEVHARRKTLTKRGHSIRTKENRRGCQVTVIAAAMECLPPPPPPGLRPVIYGSICSAIEAESVAWHPLGWRSR